MGTASCEQHSTFFVRTQPFHTVPRFFFIYLFIFFLSHTQTITIHYIYNSLQVTVIIYKKRRKGRTKSSKIL